MNNKDVFLAGLNLIEIIRHVLHHDIPPVYHDYKTIYKLAKFHHVEGISYLGIKDKPDIDCFLEWKKAYDMTCLRNIYFEAERETVLYSMKQHGLSYMPLKGINLLCCYDDIGMRMMSDNDILYGFVEDKQGEYCLNRDREKEAQDLMVKIMKELGYDIYSLKGKDDVFTKKPFYNFEMHRRLTESGHIHYDYYLNPFKYAIKDINDSHLYHLTIEEEYIFILEHAFKHYEYAGVGIRYLIDMYVYLRKYRDSMDFDYIYRKIKELDMEEFYNSSYKLCINAFDKEMDNKDHEFLSFLLSCGIYGTEKQHMNNRMKGNNKFTYILKRIYSDTGDYKDQYPIFYKYKLLTPLLPFYRLSLALIHSPKRIINEIKMLIRK